MALRELPLRELPRSAVHVPRRRDLTYEEASDLVAERWIFDFEQAGVAIRDVLAGRVEVGRFAKSSHLEFMVDLIFTFFDKERENWTCWKSRYARMEKVFARNLFNAIIAVRHNIDWFSAGARPPVDRLTFDKLMLCWGFEPFHQHLKPRQRRAAQSHIDVIEFYYMTFNQEGQEEMRHQLYRDDVLRHVSDT